MRNNPRQRWSARVNKIFPARARDDGRASRTTSPQMEGVSRRNTVPPPSVLQATNYRRIENDKFMSPHRQARRDERNPFALKTSTTTTTMGPYTCPLTNKNFTKNHPMVREQPDYAARAKKLRRRVRDPPRRRIGRNRQGDIRGKASVWSSKGGCIGGTIGMTGYIWI